MRFTGKQRPHLGIDINSSFIRVVEIGKANKLYAVGEAIPAGTDILSSLFINTLQKILKSAPFSSKNAVIAIPAEQVTEFKLNLSPQLSEREREAFIALELERYFSCALEQIYYDYGFASANNDALSQSVTVYACPAHYITERVDCLQQVGLMVQAIDIETIALKRLDDIEFKDWVPDDFLLAYSLASYPSEKWL